MHRLFLTILLLFLINSVIYSQNSYQINYWKKNNAFSDLKEYYQGKYEKDTTNFIYLKELAIYEYKNREYEKCIQHFNKFLKYSRIKDLEIYQLNGNANKFIQHYVDAKETFKEGLTYSKKTKNRTYITIFNREIESLDWAVKNIELNNQFHETQIHKLKNNYAIYNSNWMDSMIFLTRFVQKPYLVNTELFNPITNRLIQIKYQLKNKRVGNFSKINGNRIYFSMCDSLNICEIGLGDIVKDSIVNIKIVKGFNYNDSTTYTMPFYFTNEKISYLFYCSNNENSNGGLDIFFGKLIDEDSITDEQNVSLINTISDDVSPYLDEKTQTLFFSNSSMNGFGGLDIFKTSFKNLKCSKIENLGRPFNSSYNDLYFNIKDSIYTLTSNRKNDKHCCNEYYHFTKNNSKTSLLDTISNLNKENSKNLLSNTIIKEISIPNLADSLKINYLDKLFPIKLYFHNDIPNPKSKDTITNTEYESIYYEYLDLEQEYHRKNKQINTEEEINDFFSGYIPKGYNDLNELLKILSKEMHHNVKFKIQVKGFASPLASNSYNLKLSKRRINSIINYIHKYENGILSKKIGSQIIFEYLPFGEEKANKNVNDNPKNTKKSIFSIEAASERKIELVGIKILEN
jgi:hypothetical protein